MRNSQKPILKILEIKCSYCGLLNHYTDECHLYIMDTKARSPKDMKLLEQLGKLELEAQRQGLMVYEIPEAVKIAESFGVSYRKENNGYKR